MNAWISVRNAVLQLGPLVKQMMPMMEASPIYSMSQSFSGTIQPNVDSRLIYHKTFSYIFLCHFFPVTSCYGRKHCYTFWPLCILYKVCPLKIMWSAEMTYHERTRDIKRSRSCWHVKNFLIASNVLVILFYSTNYKKSTAACKVI